MNKKLTNIKLNNTKEIARPFRLQDIANVSKIGRASCRERVWMFV